MPLRQSGARPRTGYVDGNAVMAREVAAGPGPRPGSPRPQPNEAELAAATDGLGLTESASKHAVILGRRAFEDDSRQPDDQALEASFRSFGMSEAAAKRVAGY